MPVVVPLPLPSGPEAVRAVDALADALAGRGPLLVPHAPDEPPADLPERTDLDGVLAVATSGSTGTPKRAVLAAEALRASAAGTDAVLGGPARWLLALPAHHIAGLQVLLRSIVAGTTPMVLRPGPFTAESFASATERMGAGRRYVSLVPTQLMRLLGDAAGTSALASYDAVLVGGAATAPGLLARARDAGVHAVTTYGSSETAGGCVYDGLPLPGTSVRLEEGRILLGGPTLASGHLGETPSPFVERHGARWLRTDDLGRLDDDGRLVVEGRVDDVIVTGGLKVWPAHVERALAAVLPVGADCCVAGVPDPEWGQSVGAMVALPTRSQRESLPSLAELRERLRPLLPAHALPRRLAVVADLPLRGPGKPDRVAARAVLTSADPSVGVGE